MHLLSKARIYFYLLGGLLGIACTFAPSTASAIEIRVKLLETNNSVSIGSSTDAVVRSTDENLGTVDAGKSEMIALNGNSLSFHNQSTSTIYVEPSNAGLVWINGKWYRGRAEIVFNSSRTQVINYVELEDYLYSVVGGEMDADWSPEALKAQAVAARTYAIHKMSESSHRNYDVFPSTQDQYYGGESKVTDTTVAAVDATRGIVMTYQNQPILAVYHACSGGYTKNVESVWGNYLSYLRGVQDFDDGYKECPRGKGWGHGLGMSQYGASTLANRGWKWQEILNYYYTNVSFDYSSNFIADSEQ